MAILRDVQVRVLREMVPHGLGQSSQAHGSGS